MGNSWNHLGLMNANNFLEEEYLLDSGVYKHSITVGIKHFRTSFFTVKKFINAELINIQRLTQAFQRLTQAFEWLALASKNLAQPPGHEASSGLLGACKHLLEASSGLQEACTDF